MKIVRKINGEFVDMGKIHNINELENCVMVELERGDKLKKAVRSAKLNVVYQRKNTYSVKGLKEALEEYLEKEAKKAKPTMMVCAVCGDLVRIKDTNEYGVCKDCDIENGIKAINY